MLYGLYVAPVGRVVLHFNDLEGEGRGGGGREDAVEGGWLGREWFVGKEGGSGRDEGAREGTGIGLGGARLEGRGGGRGRGSGETVKR